MLTNCVGCGHAVRPGTKFCPYCGYTVSASPQVVCSRCGTPSRSGARHCRKCGQALGGSACPRCGRPNRPVARHCVHCGTAMVGQPGQYPFGTGKLKDGFVLGGRYLIISKIAQGGMAAIYEATEIPPMNKRRLAIKEMSFSILQGMSPTERQSTINSFRNEFELLRNLHHPNLVQAYEYIEMGDRQYFVMELIEGQTLEAILEGVMNTGFLPTNHVMAWARQLCNVLAFLHDQSPPIIYRDLKPSNIMEISGTQTIKLFDFGIARFYKPGKKGDTISFGTPGYLAPEIVKGGSQTSVSTDIYAMGALLHQLLTNRDPSLTPFQFPPLRSINPNVPKNVERAIQRALESRPENRLKSAEEMLKELFGRNANIEKPPKAVAVSPVPASSPVLAAPLFPPQSPPFLAPSPVPLPSAVPQYASGVLSVSSNSLDFKTVVRGRLVHEAFFVTAPPNSSGQIVVSVPWLEIEPKTIKQSVMVNVCAQTKDLSLGDWKPSTSRRRLSRIPSWLRWWIELHAKLIMRGHCEHGGKIWISAPRMQTIEIQVRVKVYPSPWRVLISWVGVFIFILVEALLLLSAFVFFLSAL